jgi:hypothetical protein
MAEISWTSPNGYYLQSNKTRDSSKERTTQHATYNPSQLPTYQYQQELRKQETLQGYLISSVDLCQSLPILPNIPSQHHSPESLNMAGQVGIEHHLIHQSTPHPSLHYHKNSSASKVESSVQSNINNSSPSDDFNLDMDFDFDIDLFPMSFICEKCSKSFLKRWKLNCHLKTHEKLFKCIY